MIASNELQLLSCSNGMPAWMRILLCEASNELQLLSCSNGSRDVISATQSKASNELQLLSCSNLSGLVLFRPPLKWLQMSYSFSAVVIKTNRGQLWARYSLQMSYSFSAVVIRRKSMGSECAFSASNELQLLSCSNKRVMGIYNGLIRASNELQLLSCSNRCRGRGGGPSALRFK